MPESNPAPRSASTDSFDGPESGAALHQAAEQARAQGDIEGALRFFRRALIADPKRDATRLVLAGLLWEQRGLEEMVGVLEPIGSDSSCFAAAENMRGFLWMNMGRSRDARDAFRKALEFAPQVASFYSNFLLSLLYDGNLTPERIANAHADFGRQAARIADLNAPVETLKQPQRRLRIGFISSDFRLHSVSYFLEPLLAHWNHNEAELVLYSGTSRPDEMTRLLKRHADRFVNIAGRGSDSIVESVRADAVDILIELSGHSSGNFLPILARRLAPIQLSWLGYPHSTGLQTIDGRLSDAYLEPMPHAQKWSVEPVLHLPRHAFVYRMPGEPIPIAPPPLLKNGFPTFISCNNSAKITTPILEMWAEILRMIPNARLIIKSGGFLYPPRAREVLSVFEERGVQTDRVELRPQTRSMFDHLQVYAEADVALDTYPYNGTTTTCEALCMGVPVVSLVGPSAISRHTPRILDAVGLSDWITIAPEAYVARAVAAVADVGALTQLRSHLRSRFESSPLGQFREFAGDFQSRLRRLWQQHCRAEAFSTTVPSGIVFEKHEALRKEGIRAAEAMDWENAVRAWTAILEVMPDNAEALGYLGLVEKTRGNLPQSLHYWEEAIKRTPENAGLWGNLGEVFRHMRRLSDAEDSLAKALQLKSDKHDARLGLATVLWDQRKIHEALEMVDGIPPESKEWAGAKNLEGNILSHLGYASRAQEAYRKAMEANPGSALYHSNFLLSLLYDGTSTARSMAEAHSAYGRSIDQRSNGIPAAWTNPDPAKRIRLGIFSADFRMHAVAFFFAPLIASIDTSRYEVFLYSGVANPDEMTRHIYGYASQVRSMVGETPEGIMACARADQIDMVIDLGGHTGNNSLPVLAQGLAPIQITWLGYPHSTGMTTIGYRISDAWMEPLPEAQQWSSEKIIHLEEGCHTYHLPGEGVEVAPLPLLNRKGPTFICCNNSAKISDHTLEMWAGVLQAIPESRLIVKNSGFTYPPRAEEIQRFFQSRGIAAKRLDLRPLTKTVRQHLETYWEADIALDTYPYNGTTTTCEALWMGLPVVSLFGNTAVSRHTGSLLRQVGLEDWAVDSAGAYVERAKMAAADRQTLQTLRRELRDRFRASPLGDADWFARRFESALRNVWCDYCEDRSAPGKHIQKVREDQAHDLAVGRALHWDRQGKLASEAGNFAQAAACYRRAGLSGYFPDSWVNFGKMAEVCGRSDWAFEAWEQAVRCFPEVAAVQAAWAEACRIKGNFTQACDAYEEALKLSPEFPGVWMNFSATCRLSNRPVRAEEAARKAISLKEDFPEAWNNLGCSLRDQGRFEEAISAWCQALEIRPNAPAVHSNLLYLLNAVPGLGLDELRSQHQLYGARYFPDAQRTTHPVRARVGQPWRIGFLSPDLRNHSVAHFLRTILPAMKREGFELVAFADVSRPDELSAELKAHCIEWITTAACNDKEFAAIVGQADLDVLIELSGHTGGNRLQALKTRLAPLHLSWLGYPTALEAGVTDYFISDEVIYPACNRPDEVICLQGGALAYGPPSRLPEIVPCSSDRPLTFGVYHSFHKLNEPLWRDWSELLSVFPDSRVKVKSRALLDPRLVERWQSNLAEWGLPLERIDLQVFQTESGLHLEDWLGVDIALDASPYNGVTTTSEALLMGVPVITVPGETPASRHAASILASCGLSEWAVADWDEAKHLIQTWASDLESFRGERLARRIHFLKGCEERAAEWTNSFRLALESLFGSDTFPLHDPVTENSIQSPK